jgi:1-acyl-sn-glycerol-3-phosphate acyltransferase
MASAAREPLPYSLMRNVLLGILSVVTRLDIEGVENVPREGPVVVAPNHLHVLDGPVVAAVIPRRMTVLAADKWQRTAAGIVLRLITNSIFVARGEADREALSRALAVLRAGNALTVAPEGTRSRTGGLLPGKNGPVYLASRGPAPIVPVVVWGQEQALGTWRRLRRPRIYVRIGRPICLPPDSKSARSEALSQHTDALMLEMARMLPPSYRGYYRDRLGE